MTIVGVKPDREHSIMTLWEWPAVQEDLRKAYDQGAYPFYENGEEVIPFKSLTFCELRSAD